MRRTFVCLNVTFFVAACGVSCVSGSQARAQDQLLDPGWQLASSDNQSGEGGYFRSLLGDEPRANAVQRATPSHAASQHVRARPPAPQAKVQYRYYAPPQQIVPYQRPAPAYGGAQAGQEAGGYQQAAPLYGAAAPQRYQAPPQYNPPRGLFEQLFARHDPAPAPAPAYAPMRLVDPAHPAIDPQYERQVVDYNGKEKPGTIIIDTPHFFLYLILADGKALRYGIGVGRPGFAWSGVKQISAMREWPDWTPPTEMLARRPDLPRFMPGGPDNPLGARALYLGSTLYRIHGSNEPWTIGQQVSSGCIRLRNQDVIDLYGRVKVGAKVIVL
jgi:lipoprotein-anchoring transpeptidase ErfK/SrfK